MWAIGPTSVPDPFSPTPRMAVTYSLQLLGITCQRYVAQNSQDLLCVPYLLEAPCIFPSVFFVSVGVFTGHVCFMCDPLGGDV